MNSFGNYARRILCGAAGVLAFISIDAALAANGPALRIDKHPTLNLPIMVRAAGGGAIPIPGAKLVNGVPVIAPLDFFTAHPDVFGIENPAAELTQITAETDALGTTHTTYQQLHAGITVFSGRLKVHQNAAGEITCVNGRFYPIAAEKLDANPSYGPDAAVQVASAQLPVGNLTTVENELVVVDPGWYGDSPMGAHLAYYVVLFNADAAIREAFFIDAHTAEILDQWSTIHTAKNRQIHDGNGGTAIPGTLARAEGQPPVASPEDVNRAYDYYSDTYDFFFRGFGRDSINGNGMAMIATVNSTSPSCPNAYWNGAQMVFCSGAVTDDIVGHELAHGVTQFTAGLIYQNQPGQLNESFSDVFGELIDLYNGNAAFFGPPGGTPWPTHPTGDGLDVANNHRTTGCSKRVDNFPDGVRWIMAEDAFAFNNEIRDMWNPPCRNHPDRALSPLQTCAAGDSGGVHSGSGVPNHAFAMITDGKTFNGYTTVGIGPIKAGAVWYRALTTYLTPASDFDDSYLAFNLAAADLIGTTPNDPRTGLPSDSAFTAADAEDVNRGLLATEMNTNGACGNVDDVLLEEAATHCADSTQVFFDPAAVVGGWTVSNSAPPTPYNWIIRSNLPDGRPGTAWFCQDPNLGNCSSIVEAGLHSLFSPTVAIPANATGLTLSFVHYIATEGTWDGGNVKVSVGGGAWQLIPASAFRFNPYNGRLNSAAQTNTNPIGGEEAWTGASGNWGTTIIDLRGFAAAGSTLQLRFDFGKDGCTGNNGWFVDDITLYNCPDCDANGMPDIDQVTVHVGTGPMGNIGAGSPQSVNLGVLPPAVGDVVFDCTTRGDFSAVSEFISIDINGSVLGTVFQFGGADCPTTPDRDRLTLPAAVFNAAIGGPPAVLTLTATNDVNATLTNCNGATYSTVFIRYLAVADDCANNLILDACERSAAGIAAFVSAALGESPFDCIYDLQVDGVINGRDVHPYVQAIVGP